MINTFTVLIDTINYKIADVKDKVEEKVVIQGKKS
jgi:hypothetical protein